jgi:hypothetical protein
MARHEPQATAGDDAEELSLEVIHPDAAGIDIGNESHYVAVPPSRDSHPVRRFGCTTAELKAMAAWLKQCNDLRYPPHQVDARYVLAKFIALLYAFRDRCWPRGLFQ